MPLVPMALLLGFYQHWQKNNTLENYYNLAEIISSELPLYADAVTGRVAFAAQLLENLQQNEAPVSILQQALLEDNNMLFLAVLKADGTLVAQAGQSEENDFSLPTSRLLNGALRSDILQASIIEGPEEALVLEFLYPLSDDYVLYGQENLIELQERLQQMRIGRTGQVYLASPDGVLYKGAFQWDPGIPAEKLVPYLTEKKLLITGLPSQEGMLVGGISSAPRLGVYVVVLQPRAEALRSLYLSDIVLVLFLLAIGMLAYFGARIFARSLGLPIAHLVSGAQAVSRGNLDYHINENVDWEELKELTVSFNKMAKNLKDYQALEIRNKVSQMKEQVFRAIAHDLRAPLLGLQGYIYMMSGEEVDKKQQKEYLARMTQAAQNLSSLLEDALAVSRVEAGVSLPQREQIELRPLLESIVHIQEPVAQAKGLQLTLNTQENLTAFADRKLLNRIVMNLVSNAVKFTSQGSVCLTAYQTAQDILIEVQDTGVGLTQEQCEEIFEPFRQTDDRAEGYGLGLFISRQLARAHGGELTVKSVPGSGSTFTLRLPKEEK